MKQEDIYDLYRQSMSLSELVDNITEDLNSGEVKDSKYFNSFSYLKISNSYSNPFNNSGQETCSALDEDKKNFALHLICQSLKTRFILGIGEPNNAGHFKIIPLRKGANYLFEVDFDKQNNGQITFAHARPIYSNVKFIQTSELTEEQSNEIDKHIIGYQKPDYSDWIRHIRWPIDNAILLVHGICPYSLLSKTIREDFHREYINEKPADYVNNFHIALQEKGSDMFLSETSEVKPLEFCQWARDHLQINLPEEISNWLNNSAPEKNTIGKDPLENNEYWQNFRKKAEEVLSICPPKRAKYISNTGREPSQGEIKDWIKEIVTHDKESDVLKKVLASHIQTLLLSNS